MPQYLAKDFLAQYLQRNIEFLNSNLLTVPGHFDAKLVINNRISVKDLDNAELRHEDIDDVDFATAIMLDSSFAYKLESYDANTTKSRENIITINTDSDCGMNSSFGSFDCALSNEIVNSIITPSLCSREIQPQSESLIEVPLCEMLDDCFLLSPEFLCKRLRAVKLADSFGVLNSNTEKLCELEVVSTIELQSERIEYQKVEINVQVVDYLFDELLDGSFLQVENEVEDGVLDIVEGLLAEIVDLTVQDIDKELLPIKQDGSTYQLEGPDIEKPEMEQGNDPLPFIPLVGNYEQKTFESPLSEGVYSNTNELPDLCSECSKELISDHICIISPSSKLTIEKKLQKADRDYGDMLTSLLSEDKESVPKLSEVEMIAADSLCTELLSADSDEVLEWDPMFDSVKEMSVAQKSIVTTVDESVQTMPTFDFERVTLEVETDDSFLNWVVDRPKLNLDLLRNLTSYNKNYSANPREKRVIDEVDKTIKTTPLNPPTKMMCITPTCYQSPLDNFMMLRTGRVAQLPETRKIKAFSETGVMIRAAMVKPRVKPSIEPKASLDNSVLNEVLTQSKLPSYCTGSIVPEIFDKSESVIFDASDTLEGARIFQQNVINVEVDGEYMRVIESLEKASWSLLQYLKNSKYVENSANLLILTPDFTRFLMKQEEKKQNPASDVLKAVCSLHALVQTVDLIIHCHLQTACRVLKSFIHEKQGILSISLESIQKKLGTFHCKHQENQCYHPKFKIIQQMISYWLKVDPVSKTIILIHRYFELIVKDLKVMLETDRLCKVDYYPNINANQLEYVNTFYNSNVILAMESEEMQACPWTYFQYVVQYEYRADSCWDQMVFRVNADLKGFASLRAHLPKIQNLCSLQDSEVKTDSKLILQANDEVSHKTNSQHTILCASFIVKNTELLVSLENKENLKLIVKDYAMLPAISQFNHQPDFTIDERTGIVVVGFGDLSMEEVQNKIVCLALRCCACHVIIYLGNGMENLTVSSSNIWRLCEELQQWFESVTYKVHTVYNISQLASLVRVICDLARKHTLVWSDSQWQSRDWLKEETCKEEAFLLSYPFINSFCAQVMLKACLSLSALLQANYNEIDKGLKWIPSRVLKAFYLANHKVLLSSEMNNNVTKYMNHDAVQEDRSYQQPKEEDFNVENKSKYFSNYKEKERVGCFEHLSSDSDLDSYHSNKLDLDVPKIPLFPNHSLPVQECQQTNVCSEHFQTVPNEWLPNEKDENFTMFPYDLQSQKVPTSSTNGHTLSESQGGFSILQNLSKYNSSEFLTLSGGYFGNKTSDSLQQNLQSEDLPQESYQSDNYSGSCYRRDTVDDSSLQNYAGRGEQKSVWCQRQSATDLPRQAVKAFQNTSFARSTGRRCQKKMFSRNISGSFAFRDETDCQQYSTPHHREEETESRNSVSMSKTKKRRLTYERVPGALNGQTRLTFL